MDCFLDGDVLEVWYALKNKNDPHHNFAVTFLKTIYNRHVICYTSDYVIDEAITLTRARLKNHEVSKILAEELLSEAAAKIIYVAPSYLPRALEIYAKYNDQTFSFTDCTTFAIMEDLKIKEALAFDSHFNFEFFGLTQIRE